MSYYACLYVQKLKWHILILFEIFSAFLPFHHLLLFELIYRGNEDTTGQILKSFWPTLEELESRRISPFEDSLGTREFPARTNLTEPIPMPSVPAEPV